jgi:hypothetical protein
MHQCPRCGQYTEGAYSEGGLRWAICDDCMDADRRRAEEERRLTPVAGDGATAASNEDEPQDSPRA